MSTVPIEELATRCTAMAATHRRLFELVGSWVADEPDPVRQRRYAIASHRHAWHAELWADRTPAIPVAPTSPDAAHLVAPADDPTRFEWYHEVLSDLIDDTSRLAAEVDPALDPATARIARLVLADLAELAHPG